MKRELMQIFINKGKKEETGWMSRKEGKEKGRMAPRNRCFVCREEGHWARNCGKKMNRDQRCFHYNGVGHMTRGCPKKMEIWEERTSKKRL